MGAQSRWVEIALAPAAEMKAFELILDLCSDDNFITEEMADNLGLSCVDTPPQEFKDIAGLSFTTDKKTIVTFYGKGGRLIREPFRVLGPQATIRNALVGRDFIGKWEAFLYERHPGKCVHYTAMSKNNVRVSTVWDALSFS